MVGEESLTLSEAKAVKIQMPAWTDLLAGVSVALVLIPQSLAYAELAGMPAYRGLYAATLPPIFAAFFASSPYLQTGPVALTALLTAGALTSLALPATGEYVLMAILLALIVGVLRVAVGVLRAGGVAYLISQPVLIGFTAGAAVLIMASQLPAALGVQPPTADVLPAALWVLTHPERWHAASLFLSALTLALVFGSRKIHPLVPGVLLATVAGIAYARLIGYDAPVVGAILLEMPTLSLNLQWNSLPALVVPGLVIAIVGFVEPSSIARTYAARDRQAWDPNREFISQGVANVASAVAGGFPVGGSFSRSALNRMAGAKTRWSGFVTGVAVLAFLPFAFVLESLPKAVLGAIVIGAVVGLVRGRPFLEFWRLAKLQFLTACAAFALTLALSPRIEQAALISIAISIGIHLWRELRLDVQIWTEGDALHFKPYGVLWFATAARLEEFFLARLGQLNGIRQLVLHMGGLGRIDVTGALVLQELIRDAKKAGLAVQLEDLPPHARARLEKIMAEAEKVISKNGTNGAMNAD